MNTVRNDRKSNNGGFIVGVFVVAIGIFIVWAALNALLNDDLPAHQPQQLKAVETQTETEAPVIIPYPETPTQPFPLVKEDWDEATPIPELKDCMGQLVEHEAGQGFQVMTERGQVVTTAMYANGRTDLKKVTLAKGVKFLLIRSPGRIDEVIDLRKAKFDDF